MELGSDKGLLQANYQCFHDLVLNVTGGDALEILSSYEDETSASAWIKLMREFGATISIRRNALVREITHIDIQHFTNMQSYRTKCMELVRKIKEQSISVEEILIYSVLYGLGPEYGAYKLIVQDKIDNKMKPTVESLIESFTNSKEVLTYANELDGKTQAYHICIQQGQNKDRHKPKCAYCPMEGHIEDKCFFKYPKNAQEWWKAKQQGINDYDKTGGKLSNILKGLEANKTQMSLAEIKNAIANASEM